jgi:hypothetical protein
LTGFLVIDERVQGLASGQGWGKVRKPDQKIAAFGSSYTDPLPKAAIF